MSCRLALAAVSLVVASAPSARRRMPPAPHSRSRSHAGNGKVTVATRPTRIVSLSPTATESLFAIGAGAQVVAVDDQSDYPKSAPKTTLSGFTPNVEAIAAYRPDLVVVVVRPEGPRRRARQLGIPVAPSTTRRRRCTAPTSRSASSARSPGTSASAAKVVAADEGADRADRRSRPKSRRTASRVYHELDPTFYSRDLEARSSAASTRCSACGTSPTPPTRRAPAIRSSRPSTSSRRAPT